MRWWRARTAGLPLALALACFGTGRNACAHGQEVLSVVLPIMAADTIFTMYDLGAFATDARSQGFMLVQSIGTIPQAFLFDVGTAYDPGENDDVDVILGVSIWLNQLAAFGSYALARPEASTRVAFGLSLAISADAALTSSSIGLFRHSRLAPGSMAILEILASTPQLALATYAVASPLEVQAERKSILLLGAWSSALFAHGIASLALERPRSCVRTRNAASFQLAPTWLRSEAGSAPGIAAFGRF